MVSASFICSFVVRPPPLYRDYIELIVDLVDQGFMIRRDPNQDHLPKSLIDNGFPHPLNDVIRYQSDIPVDTLKQLITKEYDHDYIIEISPIE